MKKNIVVTRIFNAPVELVWKSWTDPQLVMRWWGPDRFTCPSAKMDVREGGTSIVCMRSPKEFGGQDMYSIWVYQKIVPLQQIEFIQSLSDADGNKIDPASLGMPSDFPENTRTLVTFKDLGNKTTEMTVTEFDWTIGQMSGFAETGLQQSLDKMLAIFSPA